MNVNGVAITTEEIEEQAIRLKKRWEELKAQEALSHTQMQLLHFTEKELRDLAKLVACGAIPAHMIDRFFQL